MFLMNIKSDIQLFLRTELSLSCIAEWFIASMDVDYEALLVTHWKSQESFQCSLRNVFKWRPPSTLISHSNLEKCKKLSACLTKWIFISFETNWRWYSVCDVSKNIYTLPLYVWKKSNFYAIKFENRYIMVFTLLKEADVHRLVALVEPR